VGDARILLGFMLHKAAWSLFLFFLVLQDAVNEERKLF